MQKSRQQLRGNFASLVARAARQWRRTVDRRLQPLALDGSSVVRLLDALAASELVERREEDGDRRARILVPTRRGLSIAEQVEAVSREVRNAALAGVSDDQLESAAAVLELICLNLAKQDKDG